LFCYGKGIIDLDPEVSDGAFDLGVSEQKLHGSQIASASVGQGCLCSSEGVGAKEMWIQPDAAKPLGDKATFGIAVRRSENPALNIETSTYSPSLPDR
jgi:hypothetical protein